MVQEALESVPKSFTRYNRQGDPACFFEGNNSYFNPGGCSLNWLEDDGVTSRPSMSDDQAVIAKLTERLPHVRMQSCTLNMNDIPNTVQDQYRNYLSFQHCTKPMVGGYLNYGSLFELKRVLAAAVGGLTFDKLGIGGIFVTAALFQLLAAGLVKASLSGFSKEKGRPA